MIQCNGKIVTDGLVLCYDFGNSKSYPGSGSTVTNLTRLAADGSLVASPTYSTIYGGELVLNGSTQYITLSRPTALVNGGSISICMMAKWTTSAGIQALIDASHDATPRGFVIQDRGDLGGDPVAFSTVPNVAGVQSTVNVGTGQWVYLVCTNDGTNSKIYINGMFNASLAQAAMTNLQTTVYIGNWVGGAGRFMNGSLGSIQIYNKALTDFEIKQNYNTVKRRFWLP